MDHLTFALRVLLVASTTALGSLPLAAVKELSPTQMGASMSIACGMMTGCGFVLGLESLLSSSLSSVVVSMVGGAALIAFFEWLISNRDDLEFGNLTGSNATTVLVIFVSMFIHAIGEGLSIGVSAIHSQEGLNLVVLLTLAVHNIPEGMALCMAFRGKGMSVGQAAFYAFCSNMPQPLSAMPSFLLMKQFSSIGNIVPIGLGVSSGAMVYVVVKELLPEALDKIPSRRAAPIMVLSCLSVVALDMFIHFGGSAASSDDVAAIQLKSLASVSGDL
jgi:ZIP family zinc transporter